MSNIVPDQLDLFVADLFDISAKGDLVSMEFPIFSLSNRVDKEIYKYENPKNGAVLEVIPSTVGRATIHDKDILLYCFSQLAEANNRKMPISRKIHMTAYDYLKMTRRATSGKDYKDLGNALLRLRGTTIKTNISKDGFGEKLDVFGLIDTGQAITDEKGRLVNIEIVLSEQLYSAITNNNILTYNPNYFDLRSPNERRLYEIARKHCGHQNKFEINFENLYNKFGTKVELKEFRRKFKTIVERQEIPDYFIQLYSKKITGSVEKVVIFKDKKGELKKEFFELSEK